MNYSEIIDELERNKQVFYELLREKKESQYRWRPEAGKWCLLEILCHLYDEEREDFRTRVRHTLKWPNTAPPPIDPANWVEERKYMEQDYAERLEAWITERTQSVRWLRSLKSPRWENAYDHPSLGRLSAAHFLVNWLAHDYLHIRQITRTNYLYLQAKTENDLSYAGNW